MSLPDLPLVLSPEAEEDFADLLQYTLETWGDTQVYAYREVIDKALLTIQSHPQIGHCRTELLAEHWVFPAGQHIIVYRISDIAIYVSRILHVRMDIGRHV